MEENNPIGQGRPQLTAEEVVQRKNDMINKLEPFLKSGLSLVKACLEAGVSRTQLYDYMAQDTVFSDRIHQLQQYMSVIISSSIVREVFRIVQKQQEKVDKDGNVIKKAEELTPEETDFLKWYSLNSRTTRDEFGQRKEVVTFDPEAELKRLNELIDQSAKPDEEVTPVQLTDSNSQDE